MPPYWASYECGAFDSSTSCEGPAVGKPSVHEGKNNPSAADNSSSSNEELFVRFDLKNISVQEGFARSDISEDEYRALWYRKSELVEISLANRRTVRLFRKGREQECDKDGACIRGLEHQLKGASDIRQDNIVGSVYAVLREQARQLQEEWGVNEEQIADIYREYTRSCVADARQKAINDVLEVKVSEASTLEPHQQEQEPPQAMFRFDDDDMSVMTGDSSERSARRSVDKLISPPSSKPRKGGSLSRFMKVGARSA